MPPLFPRLLALAALAFSLPPNPLPASPPTPSTTPSPSPAEKTTLIRGTDIPAYLQRRHAIWFIGEPFPPWAELNLPPDASRDQTLAALRQTLQHNPKPPEAIRLLGADTPAAQHAAQEALGYHVDEVAGSNGKILALRFNIVTAGIPLELAEAAPTTAPATAPAAPPPTMTFNYDNVPLDTILHDMSQRLGIVIVQTDTIPVRLNISTPAPVPAAPALQLLNDALTTWRPWQPTRVLRLATENGPPVYAVVKAPGPHLFGRCAFGTEPTQIPLTDEIRVQVVPIKYLPMAKLRDSFVQSILFTGNELPAWGLAGNEPLHCVVLTDTSEEIRRQVESLADRDAKASPPRMTRVQLKHTQAKEIVATISANIQKYGYQSRGPNGERQPDATYFDADETANAIFIDGPVVLADHAAAAIRQLDAQAGVSAELVNLFDTRYSIWFVGEPMPGWAPVNIPEDATAAEAIALLRAALARNPNAPIDLRVQGAQDDAARQALEEAFGYRVADVPGSAGKVFALLPAAIPFSSTAPAATTTRPATTQETTIRFQFKGARVGDVTAAMSRRFGFVIIQPVTVPIRLTIDRPEPLNADEALKALAESSYLSLYVLRTTNGQTIIRVIPFEPHTAKMTHVPVAYGSDPDKIPQTDDYLTQVIPIKYTKMLELYRDLLPILGPPPDYHRLWADGRNGFDLNRTCIVITDTAAKINRIAQIIAIFEARNSPPRTQRVPLQNTQAPAVAAAMIAKFGDIAGTSPPPTPPTPAQPTPTPTPPAARGGRGGGGRGPSTPKILFFDVDPAANTLIITGPELLVSQALSAIQKLDHPNSPPPK